MENDPNQYELNLQMPIKVRDAIGWYTSKPQYSYYGALWKTTSSSTTPGIFNWNRII